ncbi:MAG: TadE/TadG family type IV pilus assembly protein [Bryobacteraceae bacterium]|jgi:Flp pilus assembly protein TadG
MSSRTKASLQRKRTSGGNAMVEWMLVMLPTFALITAFFDITFALFSWATIQDAVSEGCRYAITFQTISGDGQDVSIETTVANDSMGLVTVAGGLINVNYYTQAAPTTAIAAPNGNVPGNIVTVSIQGYPINWMVPLSGTVSNPFRPSSPANVNVYASAILGGYPAGVNSVTR